MPRDRAVPKTGLGPETQGCRGLSQRLTLFGDSQALWYNLCMKPINRLIASALILVFLLPVLPVQLCQAWSEGGHHLIAAVAFSLLTEKEQAELIAVLQKHPRYTEDFVPPDELRLLEKTRGLSKVFPLQKSAIITRQSSIKINRI